jgi:probable HAF family extracellular repeat protein
MRQPARPAALALLAAASACADSVAPTAPAPRPTLVAAAAPTAGAYEITATDLRPLGLTRTPVALNDRGEMVGSCEDRTEPGFDFGSLRGTQHAFLWSATGGYRDLGTLGGAASCAAAVNERGHVVGYSHTAAGAIRAFVWTPEGGMRDLGTLPGGTRSRALDIDDGGQVVGSSDDATGEQQAVLWAADGTIRHLGRLPDRVVTPPGVTPPSVWRDGGRAAMAINARGQVVGWARGVNWPTLGPQDRAFVWSADGGIRDLTPPQDDQRTSLGYNRPVDINLGGMMAGVRNVNGTRQGVVWDLTGAFFEIPQGPPWPAINTGLNDAGQVVGFQTSSYFTTALLGDRTGTHILPPPPGTASSISPGDVFAYAINARGDVVGRVIGFPGSPAVLWTVRAAAPAAVLLADRNSGRCLDVLGESREPGAQLVVWDCWGAANQRWTVPPVGQAGEVRVYGDQCLDVWGMQGNNGDRVSIYPCTGGANQRWTRTAAGELRGLNDKCLDVSGARTENGAPVVLWTCFGGANQRFDALNAPAAAGAALARAAAAPGVAAGGAVR